MAGDMPRLSNNTPEDEPMTNSDTPADARDAGDANGSPVDADSPDMSRFRARACARCSRSKLRCIRRAEPGAEPCLRCARLGAECTLPEARPRGPKKGQARRVGQLEQKLDGIMSLLTASQQLINQNNDGPSNVLSEPKRIPSPVSEVRSPVDASQAKELPSASRPQQQQPLPFFNRQDLAPATPDTPGHRSVPSPTANSKGAASQHDGARTLPRLPDHVNDQTVNLWPGFDITWREAARVLNVYSTLYVPNFPFVPLPPQMSPHELYAATPFLFRTIMLVTAPQSASNQRTGEKWFRSTIAEYVVALGEKRLEHLQALLLFIAWGDYRFYMESRATQLFQMSIGIVIDLGLDKPPISVNNLAPYSLLNEALRRHPHLRGKSAHSKEDMRAMLGCFYVTSQVTSLFRREHNLPYTGFIEKCCMELAGVHQYPTDTTLVALVKMQSLVRRAHAVMAGASPEPGANAIFTPPAAMALAAIRRELYEPTSSYGAMDDRSKQFLKMHCHASLIAIHEPVIYARSPPPTTTTPDVAQANSTPIGAKRTEALWHCLRAILDFLKVHLNMPLDQTGTMAIFPAANLAYSFVTTTRLLFMEDADWDAAEARQLFDFPGLAQRFMDKYSALDTYERGGGICTASGPGTAPFRRRFSDDGQSLMASYVQKTKWLMQWYLAKTMPGGNAVGGAAGPEQCLRPMTRPGFEPSLPHPTQPQQQQKHQDQQLPQTRVQQTQQPAQFQIQQQQQQPVMVGDPMVGFDATSFLEDFDDSFWHAFLSVDSQLGYPPMVASNVHRLI